jgi:cysteine synthase A
MPETMSLERRVLLLALGAEIVLTPGPRGMKGAVLKAEELLASTPTPTCSSNSTTRPIPKIHFETTGPEIWEDTDGRVDFLISGVGTGGTITGVSEYIKPKKPSFKAIAVEPTTARFSPAESRRRTRFRESAPVLFPAFCAGTL